VINNNNSSSKKRKLAVLSSSITGGQKHLKLEESFSVVEMKLLDHILQNNNVKV
jgi:hypothetical protein